MAARKNRPDKFNDRSFRKFPAALKGHRVQTPVGKSDYKVPERPLSREEVRDMILNLGLQGLRPNEDPLKRYPVESKGYQWYRALNERVEKASAKSPLLARKGYNQGFTLCWEEFQKLAAKAGTQISEDLAKKTVKKIAPLVYVYAEGIVKTGDEPIITKEPVASPVPAQEEATKVDAEPANTPPAPPVQDENMKEPATPPTDDSKSEVSAPEKTLAVVTEKVEKCSCGKTASRFIAVMEHGRYFAPKALCIECLGTLSKFRYARGQDTKSYGSREEMKTELCRLNGLVADADNMII